MAESTYKSIKGQVTIISGEGGHTFDFSGQKPPSQLREMPKYVAECVARALLGADETEVLELRAKIKDQQLKIDELIAASKKKDK